ncbi:hypothetical protein KRP22_010992 [Phytophthora ramorum]|uniref:uncharacterized protein n=1 Tax=Phytophthora ramorum TaxID=164328 RepID=UPI0030B73AA6|nr:hypothetical protein KRP23_5756 [Phytophthora ramorum]KAH7504649.1 hypothetical protein KRP22_5136 [Phytophthora ramorum]
MRACYALLAIAVALISSSGALSTSISPQPQLVSSAGVGRSTENNNRLLRSREEGGDVDEDSGDQERGLYRSVSRLFSAGDDLKKIEADIVELKAETSFLKNKYKERFQHLKNQGYDPDRLSKELLITNKRNSMTKAQLSNDGDYHLWVKFSSWWKKNSFK